MRIPKIKISVVIPAYNASDFIRRSLDSVRSQSLLPIEVLVTNDGSIDETERIIEDYSRKYPELTIKLVSQPNKGIGAARNHGIFRSSGDYIAFLDADDCWFSGKLKSVENVLVKHPDVDIVYHNEIERDLLGNKKILRYGKITGEPYRSLLFSSNKLSTSATVVRRSLAINHRGFSEEENFNSAEDYDFWLRLAKSGAKFFYLNEILGEYWRTVDAITSKIEYHANNSFNVFSFHLAQIYRSREITGLKYKMSLLSRNGERDMAIARSYYSLHQQEKAIWYYIKSMKEWPFYWKTYAGLVLSLKRHLLERSSRGAVQQ